MIWAFWYNHFPKVVRLSHLGMMNMSLELFLAIFRYDTKVLPKLVVALSLKMVIFELNKFGVLIIVIASSSSNDDAMISWVESFAISWIASS